MNDEDSKLIATRIIRTLSVYPGINANMLAVQVGSAIPSSIWKPVLEGLITSGRVILSTSMGLSPAGRTQQYNHLTLNTTVG